MLLIFRGASSRGIEVLNVNPMGENAFCHGMGGWAIGGGRALSLSLYLSVFGSFSGLYGKNLHSRKKAGELDFEI